MDLPAWNSAEADVAVADLTAVESLEKAVNSYERRWLGVPPSVTSIDISTLVIPFIGD